MKLIATDKTQQNRAAVDPWTLVHFGVGLACGLTNVPRRLSFPTAVAYEAVEQLVERRRWGRELLSSAGPETFPNLVVDLVVFALGQWAGECWNATGEPEDLRSPVRRWRDRPRS